MAEAQAEQKNSLEFMYAQALLMKLFKAKVITRAVYERAEQKCREKLLAA
jgi:hypothetical protein